jgi:hypothetical protein
MSETLELSADPAVQPVLTKPGDDLRNAGLLLLAACALAVDPQVCRSSRIKARLGAVTDRWDDLVPVIERALRDADMDGEQRLRLHGDLLASRAFLLHLFPPAHRAPAATCPDRRYRAIEAVLAEIDPENITDEMRQEAAAFLTACFMSLDPAPVAPVEILAKLTSFKPGYWRWADEVQSAIKYANA